MESEVKNATSSLSECPENDTHESPSKDTADDEGIFQSTTEYCDPMLETKDLKEPTSDNSRIIIHPLKSLKRVLSESDDNDLSNIDNDKNINDDNDDCDSLGKPVLKKIKIQDAASETSKAEHIDDDENDANDSDQIIEECINLLQDDCQFVVERQLEQIMEEFYLKHGGVLYDFYLWKKKFPLKAIIDELLLWFQTSNLGNLAQNALKLLESNLLADHNNPFYPPAIVEPIFSEALAKTSTTSVPKPKELNPNDSVSFLQPQNHVPILLNTQSTSDTGSGLGSSTVQRKSSTVATSGLLEDSAPSLDIYEKAKQEAAVMQRIEELKKAGMWSVKRLPKVKDLDRKKVHWDYVLDEMQWLATD